MNSYVKIKVTGKNIKLFLKRYIINKISYKEYKNISYKEVSLKISYEDYLNLLSKKNIYKIEVIKFYGLIKYVYFIKHNLSFLVSLSISIIFLFIISNVVFKIDVIHNEDSIRNLIKEELTDKGIKTYSLVPNFNKRKK